MRILPDWIFQSRYFVSFDNLHHSVKSAYNVNYGGGTFFVTFKKKFNTSF